MLCHKYNIKVFTMIMFLMATTSLLSFEAMATVTVSPRNTNAIIRARNASRQEMLERANAELARQLEANRQACIREQGCFITQEMVNEIDEQYGIRRISQTQMLLNRCLREDQPLKIHSNRNASMVTLACDGGRFSSSEMSDAVVYERLDGCVRYYKYLREVYNRADESTEMDWVRGNLGGVEDTGGSCRTVAKPDFISIFDAMKECIEVPCSMPGAQRTSTPDGIDYCASSEDLGSCPNPTNNGNNYMLDPPMPSLIENQGNELHLCVTPENINSIIRACKNETP